MPYNMAASVVSRDPVVSCKWSIQGTSLFSGTEIILSIVPYSLNFSRVKIFAAEPDFLILG